MRLWMENPQIKITFQINRNVLLHDPFESNIPDEITHSLLLQGAEENKFQGSESTCCICFDPTGNYLAAGTRDGRNLLWDLNVFSIKKTMIGHVAPITCIDWQTYDRQYIVDNQLDPDHTLNLILQGDSLSKSDDLLLTGSSDWNIILWNPKTGKKRDIIRFTSPVLAALLQPFPLVSSKKSTKADSKSSQKGKPGRPSSKKTVSISKHLDDDSLMDVDVDVETRNNPIRLAVIAQGQKPILLERQTEDQKNSVWKRNFLDLPNANQSSSIVACCIQFSRDGRFLFVGTNKGNVAIYCPVTCSLVSNLKVTPSSIIRQIYFSNSGRDMIINSSDRIIRAYSIDWEDDEPDIELEGKFMDSVDRTQWFDCCISADGEYVVGAKHGVDKHDLYIWDKTTGVLTKQLNGPSDGMMGMTWHPFRPVCATISGYYGCIYLWRHTPQQKFSAYEPTFTELEDNQEYEERESEFDVLDDKQKIVEEEDFDQEIDIMQVEI